MNPIEAAELLGRALQEDRLAVLVGSRTSASISERGGRNYLGLPTPSEFVQLCSKQIGYIKKDDSFNSACDKILDRDGRPKLEEILLTYYRVNNSFEPPPAHPLLAWLPVSLFLTSNYDQFIERSLEKEGRSPHVLIEDEDLVTLRRWQVPVVKYHGCVNRPRTLVAATKDYENLEERRQLIGKFIAASLAGKTLLVVGHGLGDHDLGRIIRTLQLLLKEYAPSIFVLRPEEHDSRLPSLTFKAEVINEDLTQFLSRLLQQVRKNDHPMMIGGGHDEQWMTSAFFAELRKASVLPSETQVIEAFLSHLQEEVAARQSVEEVIADAGAAVKLALNVRPNYEALRKIWETVLKVLTGINDVAAAEHKLSEFRETRDRIKITFRRLGANLIKRNDRILLYSQSQRVVQCLLGVPTSSQKTIRVFVAECRPKSPNPYQDAAATCQQLSDSYYGITVCPDVVAGHLLATHQIDRIVMGTHAVFRDPTSKVYHSFVNTCGSRLLILAALDHGVPVEVVAETLKIEDITFESAASHVHIHQENDLLESAIGLRNIRTQRSEVEHLNIGYDLIPIKEGIVIHVPDELRSFDPIFLE
jgi:translation initiation factor 2B subunit (eIF-2B alpha/beta/delta family)